MIKDNFTYYDKHMFDAIYRVTETIERLYEGLYLLEIKGLKNSDEYNRKFNMLKIFLKQEEQLYADVKFNKDKVYSWLKYLKMTKKFDNLGSNFDSVLNEKYENKVVRRIYNKLYKELHKVTLNIGDYLSNGINFISVGSENNANFEKMIYHLAIVYKDKIEEELDKDLKKTIYAILNEYINDPNYLAVKNKLIYTKYYLSFIFNKSEEYMIRHSFDVPKDTYLLAKMESDNLGDLFTESFDDVKDDFNSDFAIKYLKKLNSLDNESSIFQILLCNIFIRAALADMSLERALEIKDDFDNQMSNKKVDSKLINKCFNHLNNDKEKVKIISLK